MADVFISYKREDESRAKVLVGALRGSGLKVFWDRDIKGGENWHRRFT